MKFRPSDISKLDNQKLLALHQETGEKAYAAALYDRYLPLIYGMCLNRTGSPEQAMIEARSFFDEFTCELRSLNHNAHDFDNWLYEYLEVRLPGSRFPLSMLTAEASELSRKIDSSEDEAIRLLENPAVKLTRSQTACIHGFFIEKLSFAEIAEKGGFLLSDIREHIVRGMNMCAETQKL